MTLLTMRFVKHTSALEAWRKAFRFSCGRDAREEHYGYAQKRSHDDLSVCGRNGPVRGRAEDNRVRPRRSVVGRRPGSSVARATGAMPTTTILHGERRAPAIPRE